MRSFIRDAAWSDAVALAVYLEAQRPDLPLEFFEAFRDTVTLLERSPHLGHRRPDLTDPRLTDVRCMKVERFPLHLLFYQIEADCVVVLRLLHGSRDLPAAIGEESLQ
ncbi:MAG: type II toxin-antitoxin system RelE/ParE family toxin [Phycisphaerales bacterium]|nr:type II toxin-antitoxin system RelE/ParE family toxin [Phycisphaerales bacterium]